MEQGRYSAMISIILREPWHRFLMTGKQNSQAGMVDNLTELTDKQFLFACEYLHRIHNDKQEP